MVGGGQSHYPQPYNAQISIGPSFLTSSGRCYDLNASCVACIHIVTTAWHLCPGLQASPESCLVEQGARSKCKSWSKEQRPPKAYCKKKKQEKKTLSLPTSLHVLMMNSHFQVLSSCRCVFSVVRARTRTHQSPPSLLGPWRDPARTR